MDFLNKNINTTRLDLIIDSLDVFLKSSDSLYFANFADFQTLVSNHRLDFMCKISE